MPSNNLKQLIPMGVYGWHHHNFCRLFVVVVLCTESNSVSALCRERWFVTEACKDFSGISFHTGTPPRVQSPWLLWLLLFCAQWFWRPPVYLPVTKVVLNFLGLRYLVIKACLSQASGIHWLYDWNPMHFFKKGSSQILIRFLICSILNWQK